MTERVTRAFAHEFNQAQVAGQEYEAAKAHYDGILLQDWTREDAQERFQAASRRLGMARDRFLEVTCG